MATVLANFVYCCAHLERPNGRKPHSKFKVEWDLVFWMLGSFAMLYFTDFASHLLFNPVVKR